MRISLAVAALSASLIAGDLSEAIKGVDVSGSMRYRLTDTNFQNSDFTKDNDKSGATHDWRALITVKTPVSENFQGVVSTRYDSRSYTGANGYSPLDGKSTPDNNSPSFGITDSSTDTDNGNLFDVREVYGVWTPVGTKTSVMFGKMALNTPVTDSADDRGTGVLALSQDAGFVTLAGGAFDNFYIDQLGDGFRNPLYALAAIGSMGNFNGQLWYFNLPDMSDGLFFAEATYKIVDALTIKGQYANNTVATGDKSKLNPQVSKVDTYEKNPQLYGVQAIIDYSPISATLGYVASNKDGAFVSLDDAGSYIYAGEWGLRNAYAYAPGENLAPKNGKRELGAILATIMVDAGSLVKGVSVGLDYVGATWKMNSGVKNSKDFDYETTEFVPRVKYQATKNLELSTYYSFLTATDEAKDSQNGYEDEKRNEFRLQTLYSF